MYIVYLQYILILCRYNSTYIYTHIHNRADHDILLHHKSIVAQILRIVFRLYIQGKPRNHCFWCPYLSFVESHTWIPREATPSGNQYF